MSEELASKPLTRKYVRVIERHANGLVRFEFALGWTDLCCELAMHDDAFRAFCVQHQVAFFTEAAAGAGPSCGQTDAAEPGPRSNGDPE